jgi:hypothetical protein
MLVSPDCFALLARCVVVVSAISGPGRYPGQPVSWQQKAQALARLARSGDGRGCDAVLAAVRKRQAWAETNLKLNAKTEKELVAGISNDLENLRGARTVRDQASRMRDIESHNRTLSICVENQRHAKKMIANLLREERTFDQAVRLLRDLRRKPKAPDRPRP